MSAGSAKATSVSLPFRADPSLAGVRRISLAVALFGWSWCRLHHPSDRATVPGLTTPCMSWRWQWLGPTSWRR